MIEDILKKFQAKGLKTKEAFANKLATFRTGRANPALVENLLVESYGTKMPLKSVASISVPEPKLIIVQAWDHANILAIEKAILTSDLGLSPQTEAGMIRIIVPALTQERRQEFQKLVKQEAEKARIAVRGYRKEAMDEIKIKKDHKELSEDEEERAKELLQKDVDLEIANVEGLLEKKLNDLEQI